MRRLGLIGLGVLSIGAAPPAPVATLPVVAGSGLTADQLWAAWPAAARSIRLEAEVAVQCVVNVQGVAENCSAKTDLRNLGFESAAITLVRSLRFTPATIDGLPVPVRASVSVPFGCGMTLCTPFEADKKAPANLVPFPAWIKAPTPAEIEAAYPKAALAESLDGAATMLCRRLPDGALSQCRVTDETPVDRGFGAAALTLAGDFTGPAAQGAQKVGTLVRASVRFRAAPGRSSAATFAEGEAAPPTSPPDPPPARPIPKPVETHFYPPAAQKREVSGEATLICRVRSDDSVTGCVVARETPAGMGFGAASIQMSTLFRVGPRIVDGQVFRDDYVVMPNVFRIAH